MTKTTGRKRGWRRPSPVEEMEDSNSDYGEGHSAGPRTSTIT